MKSKKKVINLWKVCDQGVTIYINSFTYNECYNLNFWRYIMYKKITLNYRGAGIDGVEHVCQN